MPILCVFIDLAKTFDTVDHGVPLSTLERIGFWGVSYELLLNYMGQCVQINETGSDFLVVKYGVPQGTV